MFHAIGYINYDQVRLGQIRDGTTRTIMVGEMASITHQSRRTYWAYSYTSYNSSAMTPQSRILLVDYDRCVAIGGAGGANPCKRGWGSYHEGGLQFVFVDGSVHWISDTIDVNLLTELATIDGAEDTKFPRD